MLEYYGAATAVRLAETIIYASLWIVIGCVIAAVFRRMLGPAKVRSIFGDDTNFGLLLGWLVGMLLPVCSLGVIPIVREMHRAGVRRGTIVTFGLTAPLFNPMSVLYGLTMSDPIAILVFSLCAMLIVTMLGFAWNRLAIVEDEDLKEEQAAAIGIKRIIAVFDSASREMVGPSLAYIAIGIAASVSLAVLLPHGYLQNQVERDHLLAPVIVAGVATPIYSTPLLAMSQIGGMFQHGNSIGAAFSLLILGAGVNFGLLAWFGRTYGLRKFVAFVALLAVTTISLAYLIDKPLYPKGVEPAGHTHAFDVYTNPFHYGQSGLFELAIKKIVDFWMTNEFGGTKVLALLVILGAFFSFLARKIDLEAWYCKSAETSNRRDIVLPSWVLGLTVVAGLVVASVVGTYLYYPAPDDILPDLSIVNTEAVVCARTGEWDAATKWIAFADDLSRRIEVGVYLREGSVSEFKTAMARSYREKLDAMKMAVDMKEKGEAGELGFEVSDAYLRLSAAFRERSQSELPVPEGK